jgi:hypothetical protein
MGNQSPAIGSNSGSVYNNYYDTKVKEKFADPRAPLLIGTWQGVDRVATVDGRIIATGYTRIFESGSYNYSGEMSVQSVQNGRRMEIIYHVEGTGTWELNGNKYATTNTDFKTVPKVLKEGGKPDTDLSQPLFFPVLSRLKLEDNTPRGASQEYEIVELTPSTLKLRWKDIRGTEGFFEGTRPHLAHR